MARFVELICLAGLAMGAATAVAQTGGTTAPIASGSGVSNSGCEAEQAAFAAARLRARAEVRARIAGVTDPQQAVKMAHQIMEEQTRPAAAQLAKCRAGNLSGLEAMETRAFTAAHDAEKAGNYEEAVRQFTLIDENGDTIITEAIAKNQSTDPMGKIDAAGMWDELTRATTKLGIYQETGGNDKAAAQYYLRAIARMKQVGGIAQIAMIRLAFMYANNNRGVLPDDAKARALFERSIAGDNIYVALMNLGRLPKTPEQVTPALLSQLEKEMDQRMEALARYYKDQWIRSHTYCTISNDQRTKVCVFSGNNFRLF